VRKTAQQSDEEGLSRRDSPSESVDADVLIYDEEKSEREARAALWYGIAMGLVFLLGAYWATRFLDDPVDVAASDATWHDWIWIVVTLLGIVGSFAIGSHLLSIRKPKTPPYDVIAILGGAIALAIVVVLALDSFVALRSLLSLSDNALWPDAKPLWFLPLSVLGVSLPLVALLLVRGGDSRETVFGVALAVIPVFVLSLPQLYGLEAADIERLVPTMYAVVGLSFVFSGTRPLRYLSEMTLESVEHWTPRVFGFVLIVVALIGSADVSGGEDLSASLDIIWLLPLTASLVVSVVLVSTVRKVPRRTDNWIPELCGLVGLSWSLLQLSLFAFAMTDVYGPVDARSMWSYPFSLVGVASVMIGLNYLGEATKIDKTVGIASALLPVTVTAIIAGQSSPSTTAAEGLSGQWALAAYFLFAVAVVLSGLKVDTFWRLQLPVMREKSSLTRKRVRLIMSQVVKNPMGVIGLIILAVFGAIAIVGPYVAPYQVDMTINGEFTPYELPSAQHWMGVDNGGHDVFSQLLYGARTSIVVGVVAAMISSAVGAVIGLYSGYVGGWKDEVIMRLNDIVLSIPWLVLMIIIAAFMGSITLMGIILVIGLTGWSGTARLVRAQVLSLRERQYVERAKAIGSGDMHIINKHILPNAFPLVFANTILTIAGSILAEATLSFLRLRPTGTVTWGTMLSYAQQSNAFSLGLHWWIVAPGVCIVIVVLGFTLLGYALDDVMNPKLRKR
jgi:peptide/nickel transport system permease protein